MYKVVKQYKGNFYSAIVSGEASVEYVPREATRGNLGPLMAFDTFDNAKAFMEGAHYFSPHNLTVWFATGIESRRWRARILSIPCVGDNVPAIRRFWEDLVTLNENDTRQIPEGTIFCDSIKLVRPELGVMTVYKIVKRYHGSLVSPVAPSCVQELYSPDYWTIGGHPGPLMAFHSLKDAKKFYRKMKFTLGYEIWGAEAEIGQYNNCILPIYGATRHDIERFWERQASFGSPPPRGTVFCDRIKLMWRIDV